MLLVFVVLAFSISADTFMEKASKIDSIYLRVGEKTYINGKKKEKRYAIKAKIPDMMYKEVEFPALNKGEIYIYSNNKKTVHIPKLNQTIEKELDNEENYIMMVINDLKDISKVNPVNNLFQDKDKKVFFDGKSGTIDKIEYNDGTKIVFVEYKNDFPSKMAVYSEKSLVSEIEFTEVNISVKYSSNDFVLKK